MNREVVSDRFLRRHCRRGRIPRSLTPKPRLARTRRTKTGRETYQQRKEVAVIAPRDEPCETDVHTERLITRSDNGDFKGTGYDQMIPCKGPPGAAS